MEDEIIKTLRNTKEEIVDYNGDNLLNVGILDSLQVIDMGFRIR